jgi:hypothetical protein
VPLFGAKNSLRTDPTPGVALMTISQTGFLSEILTGGKIPQAKLAYFRERLRNRIHQFILHEFIARQQEGLTQAEVARVLDRRPEQINRWLGNPGNWELDSISDLMLAISKSELDFKAEPLEGRAARNYRSPQSDDKPSTSPPRKLPNGGEILEAA